MNLLHPLHRFPVIDTRNFEEMRAAMTGLFRDAAVEVAGRDGSVRTVINGVHLRQVTITYAQYRGRLGMEFPHTAVFCKVFPVNGGAEARADGKLTLVSANRSVVVSSGTGLSVRVKGSHDRLSLGIDPPALVDKLRALTGDSVSRPLRFEPAPEDRHPAARMLRRNVFFLVDWFNESAEPLPQPVLSEVEQTLMITFLCAHRHNYYGLLERASPTAGPWQVRRAAEHIAANWQQAQTLERLTGVTGASALALFRAFRRLYDCSPFEFAKRLRLRHARKMLQQAEPSTAVDTIAAACGFADQRRFIEDYSRAFGEQPLQTLRSSPESGPARH